MFDVLRCSFLFSSDSFPFAFSAVEVGIHHAEEDVGSADGSRPDRPVEDGRDDEEGKADQHRGQMQLVCACAFVIRVVDLAHHEEGEQKDPEDDEPVPDFRTGEYVSGNDDAGRRAGQSFEVAMNGCDLHIEACQTEGTEGTKEGAGNDAHPAQLMELVGVNERTGCDAEGNIIREGVELDAHGAGGVQRTGDSPVQCIGHHRDQYENRCEVVVTFDRHHYG